MEYIETVKNICFFLEKKIALFSQYLSLTRQMEETLRRKEEITLGNLIAQRRDCAQKIDKIDRHLKTTVGPGSEPSNFFPENLKKIVDGYLQTLKSLMETLEPLDRAVTVLAKQESEHLKTELLKRQTVRVAAKGYTRSIGHPARFLDTRR